MKANTIVITEIQDYIDKHLEEELNLNCIAEKVGYSKYHLSRIFAKEVGCTMHQYIKNKRLDHAANCLAKTQMPIVEIAFRSGYDSQQAFTYAFKQIYLVSPQIYRKRTTFEARMLRNYRCKSNANRGIHARSFATFFDGEVKVA
ncbi:helix-turn-helix transcriptional regulator [Anaeromicropila herbilytica]|uniref:AraC family transcriptional regulator n=1 Tax=Anaeromicropila herbilytica TaxID=2785025 RepID=A0A7R7EIS8_9FIRM|nr:AraC family transcriptional regulator [Anaeromicropila herbilytica]BCN29474.1 AraC family transcriptional regulator [Anaeromicropila herbilytica]